MSECNHYKNLSIMTNKNTITFPTLYGVDKKNKVKQWNIKVTEDTDGVGIIEYEYGYVDGKKTKCNLRVETGKNVGKKNETSPFEQAKLDAESRWKKKRDNEGYTPNMVGTKHQINDTKDIQDTILFPMLAQDYSKHKSKVIFPCYIQPKLDGYRMIFNPRTHATTSRIGKSYSVLEGTSLLDDLLALNTTHVLDGELYVHDESFVFEQYGVLRKKKLTEEDKKVLNKIQYHIYDVMDETLTYEERKAILTELCKKNKSSKIVFVDTYTCHTEQDIQSYHELFINNGYEGSMLRNYGAKYKKKYRSYDLLKKKDFKDSEYKIVSYLSEKDTSGQDKPLVVWVCETENGEQFSVRPKGVESERRWLYEHASEFIGKTLWVKYFELTDNNVPRFPTTARDTYKTYIRDTIE